MPAHRYPRVNVAAIPLHPDNFEAIKSAMKEDGVVVVDMNRCKFGLEQVDARMFVQNAVMNVWNEVIMGQPWKDEYKCKVVGKHGRVLDSEANRIELYETITSPLSGKNLKNFKDGWPLHRGFGAPCDDQVWNKNWVWDVRQHPVLYELMKLLLEEEDIEVDVNRIIAKLPTEGDNEFAHVDMNPLQKDGDALHNVCGKFMCTPSRFVCARGTHTSKFYDHFCHMYRSIYPVQFEMAANAGIAKFGLDFEKDDPLGIIQKMQELVIPAGCIVLWNGWLWHGHTKTPKEDPIEFGAYVGFQRSDSVSDAYRKAKRKSFESGSAPPIYPSKDEVHFYPKRFRNFPNILQGYIRKLPDGHECISERKTKNNKVVPDLSPFPNKGYVPPKLTEIGKKLLYGGGGII